MAEEISVLLKSASSLMHSLAEKDLADSISKAVSLNVYVEVTPLLKEEIEKAMIKLIGAVDLLTKDMGQTIADAIAGKPPLPTVPPDDAPFVAKTRGHMKRFVAKAKRFMVSVAHVVVLVTCFVVLVTCFVVLRANSDSLKFL